MLKHKSDIMVFSDSAINHDTQQNFTHFYSKACYRNLYVRSIYFHRICWQSGAWTVTVGRKTTLAEGSTYCTLRDSQINGWVGKQ